MCLFYALRHVLLNNMFMFMLASVALFRVRWIFIYPGNRPEVQKHKTNPHLLLEAWGRLIERKHHQQVKTDESSSMGWIVLTVSHQLRHQQHWEDSLPGGNRSINHQSRH